MSFLISIIYLICTEEVVGEVVKDHLMWAWPLFGNFIVNTYVDSSRSMFVNRSSAIRPNNS